MGHPNVELGNVFRNIYKITKNLTLVQFQYKLIMRISTSKYMRHKMGIEKESPNCSLCSNNIIETLKHIFLDCPVSGALRGQLSNIIDSHSNGYLLELQEKRNFSFIMCSHPSQVVNYLVLAFKWYISRQYQAKKTPVWVGFTNTLRQLLATEPESVRSVVTSLVFPD